MVYDFFHRMAGNSFFAIEFFPNITLGYHSGIVFTSVEGFLYWLMEDTGFIDDLIFELEDNIGISEDTKGGRVGRKEVYFEIELNDFRKWMKPLLSFMMKRNKELSDYSLIDFAEEVTRELPHFIDKMSGKRRLLFIDPSSITDIPDFYGFIYTDGKMFVKMLLQEYRQFFKDFVDELQDFIMEERGGS